MYCNHWELVSFSKNYTERGWNPSSSMFKAIFVNPASAEMKSEEGATDFYFSRTTASLALIGHAIQHWPLVAL